MVRLPTDLCVLVVDDEPRFRELAQLRLGLSGIKQNTYSTLEDAVQELDTLTASRVERDFVMLLVDLGTLGGPRLQMDTLRPLVHAINTRALVALVSSLSDGATQRLAEHLGVRLYSRFTTYEFIVADVWQRRHEQFETPLLDGDRCAYGMRRSQELA